MSRTTPSNRAASSRRAVWAHLVTERGLVLGSIEVPAGSSLLRTLNSPRRFHRVEEVAGGWRAPRNGQRLVRLDALSLVIPSAEERVAPAPARGRGQRHRLTLTVGTSQVTGTLDLRRGASPLAFLNSAERFFVLEDCVVRVQAARLPPLRRTRVVLVNARAVGSCTVSSLPPG